MSNFRAIATVTGVLQARIRSVLDANGLGGLSSNIAPPSSGADPGVYLHLFRMVPNTALQPMSLPTLRGDGSVMQRPQLALNLHYQLSFVGGDDNVDFRAERAAGAVMTEFEARPVLSPPEIDAFVTSRPVGDPLRASDLADQVDRVRLSMLAMDLEDHSRLWSMLNQSFHALTVGMEASAVLLDDTVEPTVSLPVATPAITVVPSSAPQIDAAVSSAREQPIVQLRAAGDPATERLILRGTGLAGPFTQLRIGDVLIELSPVDLSADEIQLMLDDASGVAAGVVGVQVVHSVDVDPDVLVTSLRPVGHSGSVAVALVPTVTTGAVANAGGDRLVTMVLTPAPEAGQQMQLLLDGTAGEAQQRGEVEPGGVAGSNVQFRVPSPASGTYLARVVIDGATSLLAQGAGGFTGPLVTLP